MHIKAVNTPNRTIGRKGFEIEAIVDHITAGLMTGCLDWMRNPQAKVSSHYLITRTGDIYQLVHDDDRAWHAGEVNSPDWPLLKVAVNPNCYTLGIEHEGFPNEPLTEPQYQASLWLHQYLVKKYGIPVDRDHIVAHVRINRQHNCPGPAFPWDRLMRDLGEGKTLAGVEDWAQVSVKKAVELGITDGKDLSRDLQRMLVMLDRLGLLKKSPPP